MGVAVGDTLGIAVGDTFGVALGDGVATIGAMVGTPGATVALGLGEAAGVLGAAQPASANMKTNASSNAMIFFI